jgi:tRNA G10  N-methylase Trm11
VPYRFATDQRSYEDFSSGRVLRSRPGQPAFPVRLARELYEQARALNGAEKPVLYDPCCGAAQLVTTLGLLHAPAHVIASDIDDTALTLARENLALLAPDGLPRRIAELDSMYHRTANPAHRAALESARSLAEGFTAPVATTSFRADAQDLAALHAGLDGIVPDIILADLPHGRLTQLQGSLATLIDTLATVLAAGGVLALATAGEKLDHPSLTRVRQLKVGHRRLTWLVRR